MITGQPGERPQTPSGGAIRSPTGFVAQPSLGSLYVQDGQYTLCPAAITLAYILYVAVPKLAVLGVAYIHVLQVAQVGRHWEPARQVRLTLTDCL